MIQEFLGFVLLLTAALVANGQQGQNRNATRHLQEDKLVTPVSEATHIVGGVDAALGEFPFYVKFEGGVLCGGSLLSPNRVLTAGHCIQNYGWPQSVRVGSTTRGNGEVVGVECGVLHPQYLNPFITVVADVAILKLSRNVTSTTEFVQLNRDEYYPNITGTSLTVIGYGRTKPYGDISNTLKKVDTFFVNRTECTKNYSAEIVRPIAHLCADVPNKGDCNGDSGGPLMDTNKTQVGVVSFGYGGCASDQYQDVYARVSSYVDWIDSQMNDDFCPEAPPSSGGGGGVGNLCGIGFSSVSSWLRSFFP